MSNDGGRIEKHQSKQSRCLFMHCPAKGRPITWPRFPVQSFIPIEEMDLPSYQSLILLNVQIIRLKYSHSEAMFLTTQNP